PDGNKRVVLFKVPGVAYVEDCSPDGKRLLLTVEGEKEVVDKVVVRRKETDIFIVDLTGKNLTNLTKHEALDLRPRFSPDGKRILFVSLRSGTSQVHVMDADGRNEKQLTSFPVAGDRITGAVFNCTWSPDGKRIAYSWSPFPPRDGKMPETYIANADGSSPTVWKFGERAISPDWR